MDDDEIQEILLGIHSRLGQIDGRTSLTVRAFRKELTEQVKALVEKRPLVGQLYLVLDGKLTQKEVGEVLAEFGREVPAMTLSVAFDKAFENGLLARKVTPKGKKGKVWIQDPSMESSLHLKRKIPKWLEAQDQIVPVGPKRKSKKQAAKKKPGAKEKGA